jgi:hypothetical protein
VAGAGFALSVFIRDRLKPPEQKILASFLKKMEKRGYRKKASQGLEEFVCTVKDGSTGQAAAALFVKRFQEVYFRDKIFTRNDIRDLKQILSTI